MALSEEQRKVLRIALGSKGSDGVADEIADAIDAAGNSSAADVDELGPLSGTYAIPAEPTGAEVDASVQVVADKVDEIIQALQAAGLMDS
jgi:hypothetical protein